MNCVMSCNGQPQCHQTMQKRCNLFTWFANREEKEKTTHREEIKLVQITLISPLFIITFPTIFANGNNNNLCRRIMLGLLAQIPFLFTRQGSHFITW